MHPDAPHPDISRDPMLDGRDSLRLVKLRLALTLITVAILPVAAVAPLVRAVSEEARVAHHLRLDAQASEASVTIERELDAVVASGTTLAADPAIAAAVASGATTSDRAAAGARLGALLARRSGDVLGSAVLDGSTVVASWGSTLTLPSAPNPGVSVVPAKGDQPASLLVVSRGPGAARGRPTVVSTVSMSALLSFATPDPPVPGEAVVLTDGSGQPVSIHRGSIDAAAIAGQVLDLATEAAHDSDGSHGLDIAGLDGWSVAVTGPIPIVDLPLPAIASLGILIVLLAGFTLWMARQILRPAAQLEASRSRLHELYESAREAALRDSLTGLGNHRAFQESVARMVEGSRRYGTTFSLVLFDIDEFKRINDTRGHAVGDQVLDQLGELIRLTIRHTDAGFRVGGDEFAILLPHTDAQGAVGLCRRLLARALEDRGAGAYRGPISFSAGVTACPTFGVTRLELVAQADAALYRGKRAGRTVVTTFDPAIDRGHVDDGMRAELSSAISAVIESGTLTPVFQPIVELSSGRILGYEGLVRVPQESVFPHTGALFDAAEAAGRVQDLDRAALDVVLAGARAIRDDVLISLNVSPRTLESGELNATVFLAILRRHGIAPDRVILELTEREVVREPEVLREALRGVQRAGVRVAADDVGAGNAGLRLLSQFQFDVVKIDLSLVQGGTRGGSGSDQTLSVLGSLVQMADRLGALTIAEGVETPEQLRTIRELGIVAGQGYLLGRPGPEHNLARVDLEALGAIEEPPDPQSPFRPGPERIGARTDGTLPDLVAALAGEADPGFRKGGVREDVRPGERVAAGTPALGAIGAGLATIGPGRRGRLGFLRSRAED
jgi:diguanylate cyclase (GGDEF)-like protein